MILEVGSSSSRQCLAPSDNLVAGVINTMTRGVVSTVNAETVSVLHEQWRSRLCHVILGFAIFPWAALPRDDFKHPVTIWSLGFYHMILEFGIFPWAGLW